MRAASFATRRQKGEGVFFQTPKYLLRRLAKEASGVCGLLQNNAIFFGMGINVLGIDDNGFDALIVFKFFASQASFDAVHAFLANLVPLLGDGCRI